MDDDSFIRLVAEMRQAQKIYFRTRSPKALEKAKGFEIAVDMCIKEHKPKAERREQKGLFDE
jgi:hypothetical protein